MPSQVGAHASLLLLVGAHSHARFGRLVRSYGTFYVLGTAGAMAVPVVGTTPLTSLEHLLPLAAFVCIAAVALVAAPSPSAASTDAAAAAVTAGHATTAKKPDDPAAAASKKGDGAPTSTNALQPSLQAAPTAAFLGAHHLRALSLAGAVAVALLAVAMGSDHCERHPIRRTWSLYEAWCGRSVIWL